MWLEKLKEKSIETKPKPVLTTYQVIKKNSVFQCECKMMIIYYYDRIKKRKKIFFWEGLGTGTGLAGIGIEIPYAWKISHFHVYLYPIISHCKLIYESVPQKWSVRLSPSVMDIMSFAYMRNERYVFQRNMHEHWALCKMYIWM